MALTKVTEDMRTLGTGEVLDANIATDTISIGKISGSAAGAAGTFLKQDGTWATAGTVTDTTVIEDDIALLGFKVAANGSFGKYNLVDQTEDAFMDATGIDASASTGEVRNAANYYSGISTTTPTVTGGTITVVGDYTIHSFLTGVVSYVTDTQQDVDILILAGGGGGGGDNGGGGGAGGMLEQTAVTTVAATHSMSVGSGGSGGVISVTGLRGNDSTVTLDGVLTYTATAGGGGGNSGGGTAATAQKDGGSAGGSGQNEHNITGSAVAGQGYVGGITTTTNKGGSGGGGAGAAGADNTGGGPSDGGDGRQNNYRTGVNVWYGGGGGGGDCQAINCGYGDGGQGGGGHGGGSGQQPVVGTTNLGGGGGGGGQQSGYQAGYAGGSGLIVIKRLTDANVAIDMTLQSNSTTANDGAPTKGDIVMTYTNGAGTATLNTDLTAEFSADNGSTWTSTTLVAQGTTGTHLIVSAHDVTRTSTSGTSMVYRIKTLNQGVSKETRIQAVSLGWS